MGRHQLALPLEEEWLGSRPIFLSPWGGGQRKASSAWCLVLGALATPLLLRPRFLGVGGGTSIQGVGGGGGRLTFA